MALVVKNPSANAGDVRDKGPIPGSGRSPGERIRQPTPVFLPGESDRQRSLAGYSSLGRKESDTTERRTLGLFILVIGPHTLQPKKK